MAVDHCHSVSHVQPVSPIAYTRWRSTSLGQITESLEQKRLLQLAGDVVGKRVLEIGCGDGELLRRLVSDGADVTGIDVDQNMLTVAIAKAPNARILRANACSLPFEADTFDLVFANTVLCLVPDRNIALTEAYRVLRPGGQLIVGELGLWSLWALIRRVKGALGSQLWRHAHFVTRRSLTIEFEQVGLTPVTCRGSVYYPPCGLAARLLAPLDIWLGQMTTFGAAYIGAVAEKPGPQKQTMPLADRQQKSKPP